MWWLDPRSLWGLLLRLAGICAACAMLAGCFQPLYGDVSLASSPSVAAAMAAVDPTAGSNPVKVGPAELKRLYENAFAGRLE